MRFTHLTSTSVHSSWKIFWLFNAIIAGVVLSHYYYEYFLSISWLLFGCVFLTIGALQSQRWVIVCIVIGGMAIGLWRGSLVLQELTTYQQLVGRAVIVRGIVSEDVVRGKRGDTHIVVRDILMDDQKIPGTIWLSTRSKTIIQRSDTIEIYGIMKNGFGSFNASMSGATIRKVYKGNDTARDARDWFSGQVRQSIKEPEASLGIGFLVGQRSSLPEELDNALRVAGLTHIVVASGYNLTILLRLARRLFEKISKYLTALFGGLLITGFILVTGLSPSMSRAGLVAGLSLAAWYYGRTFNPFILLSIVAGISVLVNPTYIWGDVGWYLSFAAFAGVMIIAPLLHHYFFGPKKPTFFRQILFETVSALIMTIPIILIIFQQYSTYALLANILVVPIIPIVMFLVFIAGIIPLTGFFAELSLRYITHVVSWINVLPQASGDASISNWAVIAWYSVIIICAWYMWHITKHDFRQDNLVE